MKNPMIKVERASEETINWLMEIGALIMDDSGIHANAPGIYRKGGDDEK